jgi:hypothetical protein
VADSSAMDTSKNRYGPVSFVVALAHILIVVVFMWLLAPYSIVLVLPEVLVYMAFSAVLARGPGKIGQVGRGMLIGSLSGPLSVIIFVPVWIIAEAIGPI